MTDLIILAAMLQQRTEIEEALLKLRLKQKCFVALAADSPWSVVQSPKSKVQSPKSERVVLKIFPGGSADGVGLKPDSSSAAPFILHGPTTDHDETVTTIRERRAAKDPINPYPKGRWTL